MNSSRLPTEQTLCRQTHFARIPAAVSSLNPRSSFNHSRMFSDTSTSKTMEWTLTVFLMAVPLILYIMRRTVDKASLRTSKAPIPTPAAQPALTTQLQATRAHVDLTRVPRSVNYHFTRQCNYQCGFCFHTAKTSHVRSHHTSSPSIDTGILLR